MKKTYIIPFAFLFFCIILTSCSKKNRPEPETSQKETTQPATASSEKEQTQADRESLENKQPDTYDNPIDSYFLPLFEEWETKDTMSAAEYRSYQDLYELTWKTEYNHIIKWMLHKCKHKADKKNIRQFHKSIQKAIDLAEPVIQTEMCDNYKKPLWPSLRSGTGTRSAVNQQQGEFYRDISMQLIQLSSWDEDRKDQYKFIDRDYSQLSESDLYDMLQ